MVPLVVPLHMGALHPVETLVMTALALGPFVVLALVVTVVSRRDRRTEPGTGRSRSAGGQATRADLVRPEAATATTTETAAPQSVQQ